MAIPRFAIVARRIGERATMAPGGWVKICATAPHSYALGFGQRVDIEKGSRPKEWYATVVSNALGPLRWTWLRFASRCKTRPPTRPYTRFTAIHPSQAVASGGILVCAERYRGAHGASSILLARSFETDILDVPAASSGFLRFPTFHHCVERTARAKLQWCRGL